MNKMNNAMRTAEREVGFTLVELVIVVLVIGILGSIAYPAYTDSVMRAKRAAARACLSNFATFMERYYTTNMRYDQDADGTTVELPDLDCASAQNTGENYTYSLAAVAVNSFSLQAAPKGQQASRDTTCATLGLSNTGAKTASGSGGEAHCW